MSFNAQNYINEILRKQTISNRILKLSDILQLTEQTMTAVDQFWSSLGDPDSLDLLIIRDCASLLDIEKTPSNVAPVMLNLSYNYARKMVMTNQDVVVSMDRFLTENPEISTIFNVNVFGENMSIRSNRYKELLRVLLSLDTNIYSMFNNFKRVASSGVFNSATMSGFYVCATMFTRVSASDEFDTGQLLPTVEFDQSFDVISEEVDTFTKTPSMTLKNLQENVFNRLFEEA